MTVHGPEVAPDDRAGTPGAGKLLTWGREQERAGAAQDLDIKPVSEATSFFNPMGQFLHVLGPVRQPRVDEPPAQGLYECLVNLSGGDHPCEGLGLCNSGCGSERKRNALQVYLPRALARDCELVPNARVVDINLVRDQPQGAPRAAYA